MISSSSITRIVPLREVGISWVRLITARLAPDTAYFCGRDRQRERKPRPLPDRAVAANQSVVFAHDAVGDRQPETGPAADGLRREEGIVDARELLGGNPRPR